MVFRWATRRGAVRSSRRNSVGVSFHLASAADEDEVRRLLRDNPIGGDYALSLEREPDGLAGAGLGEERKTVILARCEQTGAAIGLCERVVRPSFVDGRRALLPYLGALRVAASHRHRLSILKGGFRAVHAHGYLPDELPFALTSITADNAPARRILTAGLAALPHYEPISDYVTFVFRPRRQPLDNGIGRATEADLDHLAQFLQRTLSRHQFAPAWTAFALGAIGADNIIVHRTGDAITGCLAIWDQSSFKQTVVRGYPRGVALARPMINMLAPILGRPQLPAVGTRLGLVYLSALGVEDDRADILVKLLGAALDLASLRGHDAAALGLDSRHPWLRVLRRDLPNVTYRSELYCVTAHGKAVVLQPERLTMPEIGLL